MDLISIIVPVYGVEMYLDRCVESLVNQKDVQIEIILVDDGSPDKCPQMCDSWAEKDPRIRVIHKSNGGLSDARNAGLKIAKGNYIAFVDSDDWVALSLYRVLLDAIKKTKSDIACCKILRVWDNAEDQIREIEPDKYEVYDTKSALYELITDRNVKQVVWNKLYRHEILCDIWFEVGKYNEDEFWTYHIIGNANQVVSVDYLGYFYLQRNNSIMGTAYSMKRLDAIEAKVYRQEYLMREFPDLAFIGKINLLYTCFYHGQLACKYLDMPEKRDALTLLKRVFNKHKPNGNEMRRLSAKDIIWLNMGKNCFEMTCIIRNILKVGY